MRSAGVKAGSRRGARQTVGAESRYRRRSLVFVAHRLSVVLLAQCRPSFVFVVNRLLLRRSCCHLAHPLITLVARARNTDDHSCTLHRCRGVRQLPRPRLLKRCCGGGRLTCSVARLACGVVDSLLLLLGIHVEGELDFRSGDGSRARIAWFRGGLGVECTVALFQRLRSDV